MHSVRSSLIRAYLDEELYQPRRARVTLRSGLTPSGAGEHAVRSVAPLRDREHLASQQANIDAADAVLAALDGVADVEAVL